MTRNPKSPLAAVFLTTSLLLGGPGLAQQSQEVDTQDNNQTTAATTTGFQQRGTDFSWNIPLEFKDISAELAEVTVHCIACEGECFEEGLTNPSNHIVTEINYKIEFPDPAPRSHKQTITTTSKAGFISRDGKQTKLEANLPSGKATHYLCDFVDISCRTENGLKLAIEVDGSCGEQLDPDKGQAEGKISK